MAGTASMVSPGFAMSLVGMGLGASGADKRRAEYERSFDRWLPTTNLYQRDYFRDLGTYLPEASKLSRDVGQAEYDSLLAQRERALPGYGAALQQGATGIFELMKGELPQGVLNNFMRAGGANSAMLGMGGSSYDALNTGLFGARGSLGAMQTGFGLLPALLGALPNPQATSVSSFLQSGVMNPQARTQTQLAVRGQNIGIANQLAGMPTSTDMWGQGLTSMGGQIMGGDAATINTAIGSFGGMMGGGM
jgi:hypothetical protein